ncbi:MAG: hypothetical protein ACO3C4_04400 [Candidatus Limnocylindrus sp.]
MAESAARIEALTRLQQRWGAGIIRRGVEVGDAGLRVAPVRGTGVAALDALLGRRGLPDGITLLRGALGSGRTTLALRALAATQAAGGAAAWIDASHSFDPLEAATRGVALRDLPILVPLHTGEAIEMAGAILAADAADLLVLDLSLVRGPAVRSDALERLAARARRAGTSLMVLLDDAVAVHADAAVSCAVVSWLRVGGDLLGRRVLLTLTAGPRTGASGVVDVYEGRNARADLRIGRLPVEEVACAPLRSTGQH